MSECEYCNASGGTIRLFSVEGVILCLECAKMAGYDTEELRPLNRAKAIDSRAGSI